jgi:hypothetical protein
MKWGSFDMETGRRRGPFKMETCKDCYWFSDSFFKSKLESHKGLHKTNSQTKEFLSKTGFCHFNPPSQSPIEDGYNFPTCDIDDFCSKFKQK